MEPGETLAGLSSIQTGGEAFKGLKTFLKKYAVGYHRQNLAKTYLATEVGDKPKVVGYITVVCGEIVVEDGMTLVDGVDFPYRSYPAVKIARLLVDSRYRRNGLGRKLIDLVLGLIVDKVCPHVGCRFVVVDAKRESVKFYERYGFTLLDTKANRHRDQPIMFMDLHKVEQELGSGEEPEKSGKTTSANENEPDENEPTEPLADLPA
jgi:GNAT superfamily N-acetyltransferase